MKDEAKKGSDALKALIKMQRGKHLGRATVIRIANSLEQEEIEEGGNFHICLQDPFSFVSKAKSTFSQFA